MTWDTNEVSAAAVAAVVTLGMIVILPLGLRLLNGPGMVVLARWWPLAGAVGAAAIWLPRGPVSVVLACAYAVATGALVAAAAARLATVRRVDAGEFAVLTALVSPSIAAVAMVAERAGVPLFGFDLDILTLTVPHLHYAGFAAALVAALVWQGEPHSLWARIGAWSVPAGTLTVLGGYFIGDLAELLGTLILLVGMWAVAAILLTRVSPTAPDTVTRVLLVIAAVVLPATMLVALSWAVGEATGLPHPEIEWMVLTHGVGNALGFALCAVVAWHRIRSRTGELL